MILFADVIAGPLAVFFDSALLAVLLLIAAGETLVLWLLRWRSLARSLLDSLAMNLASALLGMALLEAAANLDLGRPASLLAAWALSVVVEAMVLGLSQREAGRRAWIASAAANTISYAVIAVLVALA